MLFHHSESQFPQHISQSPAREKTAEFEEGLIKGLFFSPKVWTDSWKPQGMPWYPQQVTVSGAAMSPRLKRLKEEEY